MSMGSKGQSWSPAFGNIQDVTRGPQGQGLRAVVKQILMWNWWKINFIGNSNAMQRAPSLYHQTTAGGSICNTERAQFATHRMTLYWLNLQHRDGSICNTQRYTNNPLGLTGWGQDSSAHTDLTHLYTQQVLGDSSVHTHTQVKNERHT